jgi:bilirubin oxidase
MNRITRRRFVQYGTAAGASLMLPLRLGVGTAQAHASPTLDPASIPKFTTSLVIPPAMPRTAKLRTKGGKNGDYYEIAVAQFAQQILPGGYPATTVWSYGSVSHPGTFNYPAFTIEAKWRQPTRVKWVNGLVDAFGNHLPHLLPVDPTLHWANPHGDRDTRPTFTETPSRYTGPVPIVTHVHGAHTTEESDGYPEAWYLPRGHGTVGTWYERFAAQAADRQGAPWDPGSATFEYPNDQRATTLWYHDHTLGMTRLNVYAGPAGFYLLRGGPSDEVGGILPGPAPALDDRPALDYYEIPIAIQDRSFNADGSLFYPDTRAFFDGYAGPYVPHTDLSPMWNPEFFGNTMVVNGRTWPTLDVERRRYRLRLLNGCNSRFLLLELEGGVPFWQIGAEGGFLPHPVQLDRLLMAPAERADVIVDFTDVPEGTRLVLRNHAPDEPFGGGTPDVDFAPADPTTTGQVMQFRVVRRKGGDPSTPPDRLTLPSATPLPAPSVTRQLSLNEMMSMHGFDGPAAAMLGEVVAGEGVHRMWMEPPTETPATGATEVWELYNFTEDAHPIHLHLVQFEVVDRQPFDGTSRPPESWEAGPKDTVIAYPEEITRIKARFDLPGRYVWHCHIVEHEDNEMMRPYQVG